MKERKPRRYIVAVFGGAVAGSEAAFQLANRGFGVVLFEQGRLPYGKIEDGLPKWHFKLRNKEERRIDEKINHPGIYYVPEVKLGRDIQFQQVLQWGFSAVILATGAWRDRPLPITGIDEFINKGLLYQNPFVYWFNHKHEPNYSGPRFEVKDNAMVIGGGLASLDVVKILMIETVQQALEKRGINKDMFTLEHGIDKVLDGLGLSLQDLGLKGCTLYYRRRSVDMPLSPMPTDTPEMLARAQAVRQKILDNFQRKYLFNFVPCCMPWDMLVDDGQLKGIVFQRTSIVDGRPLAIENDFFEVESPLVISSIGSIPEKIPGIPSEGNVFKISDAASCRIDGFDRVFAIGNAVTGKGNINESIKHSKEISTGIIDNFLEVQQTDYEDWHRQTAQRVDRDMQRIIGDIERQDSIPANITEQIFAKVSELQKKAGFDGNYTKWVQAHTPVRLERMIDKSS